MAMWLDHEKYPETVYDHALKYRDAIRDIVAL
jgi:hypothetical protein